MSKSQMTFSIYVCHQIAAIRKGLLRVIPEDVLRLITWQELEKRICGEAEISLEALQKSGMHFKLSNPILMEDTVRINKFLISQICPFSLYSLSLA